MPNIIFSRSFLKQVKKLNPSQRKKLKVAIQKFKNDPKDKSLKSHKLSGKLNDLYSFSVNHSLRVVFDIDQKKGEFHFLKVGGHKIYQ